MYVQPIHYDPPFAQSAEATATRVTGALVLAATVFVASLLGTATLAVKLDPAQRASLVSSGP